jgi:hypothetical protein
MQTLYRRSGVTQLGKVNGPTDKGSQHGKYIAAGHKLRAFHHKTWQYKTGLIILQNGFGQRRCGLALVFGLSVN